MSLRSLSNVRVLNAALQSFAALPQWTCSVFHTSSATLKKKKPSYNRYTKLLLNRKKVYTGYAYEVLEHQKQRTLNHSDDAEDEDFEEELLSEGRRRRSSYFHSRKMKELQKGPGPRLLTWQQMEHVRFLNQTEPEEWDIQALAHSFQVPELVIRKVLRNKKVLSPMIREKLDAKAHENQGIVRLPHAKESNAADTSLTVTEKSQSLSSNRQWGLPDWKDFGWFSGYENARICDSASKEGMEPNQNLSKNNHEDGITWLDDDDCEFYEYLYRSEELKTENDRLRTEEEEYSRADDEENNKETDFIHSDDGKSFYYGKGELVYRI